MRRVASFSPSYKAKTMPSAVTRPPILTPFAQSGSGTSGSVTRVCVPGIGEPRKKAKSNRMAITTSPSLTNAPYERAQGASVRRAATTYPATPTSSPSSSGSVVREAAVARPSAHSHQAAGVQCGGTGRLRGAHPRRRRACHTAAAPRTTTAATPPSSPADGPPSPLPSPPSARPSTAPEDGAASAPDPFDSDPSFDPSSDPFTDSAHPAFG